MGFDVQKLKTDATKETEGAKIPLGDDASITLARMYNERFTRLYNSKIAMLRRKKNVGVNTAAEERQIMIECLCETIIIGWEGFTDNGKPLPYSPETARHLLTEHTDFRDLIVGLASDIENFRAEADEATEKN